jgi:hypothetical protein
MVCCDVLIAQKGNFLLSTADPVCYESAIMHRNGASARMFLEKLEEINQTCGGTYNVALENCRQDWPNPGAANVNIPTTAAQKLIAAAPTLTAATIDDVVAQYASHQAGSGAAPQNRPDEPLRRVAPYNAFVYYCLGETSETVASIDDIVLNDPGLEDIPLDAVRGTVGTPGRCSWWTWGPPPPDNAADYVEQLALPHATIGRAAQAKGAVEISIPHDRFPADLYKPSALDGFMEVSRFAPDLTEARHGWSKPDNQATHPPRRELVSRSFLYEELKAKGMATLSVLYLPYHV